MTEGRLRLGVGIGWNPVEFEALGQSATHVAIATMGAVLTTVEHHVEALGAVAESLAVARPGA